MRQKNVPTGPAKRQIKIITPESSRPTGEFFTSTSIYCVFKPDIVKRIIAGHKIQEIFCCSLSFFCCAPLSLPPSRSLFVPGDYGDVFLNTLLMCLPQLISYAKPDYNRHFYNELRETRVNFPVRPLAGRGTERDGDKGYVLSSRAKICTNTILKKSCYISSCRIYYTGRVYAHKTGIYCNHVWGDVSGTCER